MLKKLDIQNYAIIDHAVIDFDLGLNIITGETGAGKSIVLGALNLILGQRADASIHFDKNKKCVIEGEFSLENKAIISILKGNDLDVYDQIYIRRELIPGGRSRAFINDTPVKLKLLQTITSKLISVHQQFSTLEIFTTAFQLKVVDAFAKQLPLLSDYQKEFNALKEKEKQLADLNANVANNLKEKEFLIFQLNEIEELKPNAIEDATLESLLAKSENAETIQATLTNIYESISSSDNSIEAQIRIMLNDLNHISEYSVYYANLSERLNASFIELQDFSQECALLTENVDLENTDTETLAQRLDSLNKIYFKHQVNNSEELINLFNDLKSKLQKIGFDDSDKINLEKEIKTIKDKLTKLADKLSVGRSKVKNKLEKEVHKGLATLAMGNARFVIEIKKDDDLNSFGNDQLRFLFSANPGSPLNTIKQVASGGELSRLALTINASIADKLELPTLVFDEIDSGVSGDIALQMGRILRKLARGRQVIIITHSPQVAAMGDKHFYVEKNVTLNKTLTEIRILNKSERLEKIAVMLSTNPPTKAAKANAKELLAIN